MGKRLGLAVLVVFLLALPAYAAAPTPTQVKTTSDLSDAELARLHGVRLRIERALSKYRTLSMGKDIYEAFSGRLLLTRFIGGGDTIASKENAFDVLRRQPIEIVTFSRDHLSDPQIEGLTLFYNPDWNAIFCIDEPFADDAWFDAFLMHEFVHALHKRQGILLPNPTPEERAQEEIVAHDFERAVLSSATGGKYEQELQKITKILRGENGWIPLSPAHFDALNALFVSAGPEEEPLRHAQEAFDMRSAWIERRFPFMDWQTQKIAVYLSMAYGRE